MKHLPKWLENSLSRPIKEAADGQPRDHGDAKLGEGDLGVELSKDLEGFLVDEAPMPGSFSDTADVTVPNIEILKSGESGGDKPTGFDPYDTVKMHKT